MRRFRTAVTPAAGAAATAAPQVRVNQVGYATYAPKMADVMLTAAADRVRFEVTTPGRYQIKTLAPAAAASPSFTIGSGSQLYGQLVDNAVRYFTSERDGADVDPAVLHRQPANLTDENAQVYADPTYDSDDNLLGTLKKTGGPVDVSGGWFDAGGGYEKFVYTASYADALMLIAARGLSSRRDPDAYPTLRPEADFGLPQAEDKLDVKKGGNPGPSAYYVKYRQLGAATDGPSSPDNFTGLGAEQGPRLG